MQGNYKSRVQVGKFFQTHHKPRSIGYAAAAAYFVSSALHKDSQGAFDTGFAYALGKGVPKDQGLSALFFEDCVKYEKRAVIPVYLARKYLSIYLFLKKHGKVLLLIIPLWLVAFAAIIAILVVHEYLSDTGVPATRDTLHHPISTQPDAQPNAEHNNNNVVHNVNLE